MPENLGARLMVQRGLHRLASIGLTLGLVWLTALRPLWAHDGQDLASSPPSEFEAGQHFDEAVAPVLAAHCLECHDTATKEGGLDLTRKASAFAGGDSGPAIIPGKSAESLLWQYVESDDMPRDRPPLSPQQKDILRNWIDAGAAWSGEVIEPAAHKRAGRQAYNSVRRLTVPEYIETVRCAVGVNIEQDARRILPPDLRADGFSNTAYNLTVDLDHVEAYAQLAETIVSRMDVAAFARQYNKSTKPDDANMRRLIRRMGKWVLRGPLEQHEIESFLRVSKAVAKEDGDFPEAAGCVLQAMLQSPRFIYRIEQQRGDGAARRADDFELASRLSYAIWGGPPDEELMKAANDGQLSQRDAVESQVRRMLQDPRAVERSAWFVHEWLHLGRLDNLKPNPDHFPKWEPQLADDMRAETLAYFKEVAWEQNRPLADLMNAQLTFVTPRLAAHYGLEVSDAAATPRAQSRLSTRERDADGLEVLYNFQNGDGDSVQDDSGAGEQIELKISNKSAVRWSDEGLTVESPTSIASAKTPKRLISAIKESNALSLEAWVTPTDTKQNGPARILSLSSGTGARNFTLGQDGDRYDVRLRSTRTDGNGMPSLASPKGAVELQLTHVAFTRDATGRTKLYVDGQQKAAGHADGDLSNWDEGFKLAVANETSGDRPWHGTIRMLAIYSRPLTPEEIQSRSQLLRRYDLASVPCRGGLLTHGSVLTIGGNEASMVTRGLFVLRDVLYSEVGGPPPCVDTTPVPTKAGLSRRAIAEARLANSACTGCHSKFEPLAFALEKFDGLGSFHEVDEHGNKLREDGEILFPGQDKPVRYESAAKFLDLLAASERVRVNITRKVTQFAIGRPLVASDDPLVEEIHRTAQEGGGTYASLITAVVMSDLVQRVATEDDP